MPTEADLFDAVDATWPAHKFTDVDGWIIRDGRSGGQRVSVASGIGDISVAEAAMGQEKLFMIQVDQAQLDAELADRGCEVKEPVDLLVGYAATIADGIRPKLDAIFAEFPMPILAEIWAEGGIGSARLDVMERANCDKTFVMGRIDACAAAAFVGVSNGICMAHAVEALAREQRRGVAEKMMRAAAWWGLQHGAATFCVLTTQANSSAQRLYRKLGMETATQYHYRIKT